ncbi:diguanylate cyclase [Actinophytocola sp. NPDC049390]|uniref:diguanylate cyclase n=1 Tax=Actinophytocola sp. NPDC049390 TaxID=3363894 RepID=UPI0037983D60
MTRITDEGTRTAVWTGRLAWIYLASGLVVMAGYYLALAFDAPPLARVLLYSVVSTSSAIAVLYACYRFRPKPLLPWLLLGFAEVIYAAADTSFYVSHYIVGDLGYPALADVFYLSHYPLVVAGLVLLIRLRTPGRDLPALLDATLVAVVAGMLSWLYVLAPTAQTQVPTLAKAASLAYPMMDLAMFAVALRLILGSGRRPTAFLLLCANLLAFFTADTIYVLQQLSGTYVAGNFIDAIWLTGNLALGAAALHPTMRQVGDATPVGDPGPGPVRIVALCAAALVAPATLLVEYARDAYDDIPVIAVACGLLFLLTIARLAVLVAQQRQLAITDVLTGLRTRRYFENRLTTELAHARRTGTPLAVLIADVDHFKSINDAYGHPGGDRVLVEIATRLRHGLRHEDVISRYGGEEFAVLLRGATADEPVRIAERLRHTVSSSPVVVGDGMAVEVTISVGTATFPLHGSTQDELVTAADRALYAAKCKGRNRIDIGPCSATESAGGTLAYLEHAADVVDGWLSDHEHGRAVSRWAGLTAVELGLDSAAVRHASLAGHLHDVGKILVPKEIWTKTTPLSDADWQLIRRHPEDGYRMLCVVPGLADTAVVVLQHHERFDGNGYPAGLAGEQIRREARIVAVCDAWAAMLACRPYQMPMTEDQARGELVRCRGSQLDPEVVDAFLHLHTTGRLGTLARLPMTARPIG